MYRAVCTALVALLIVGAAPPPLTPKQILRDIRRQVLVDQTMKLSELAAHADRFPDDPSAIEALLSAVTFTRPRDPLHARSLKRLNDHYAKSRIVEPMLVNLGLATGDAAAAFIRQVGLTHPDKRIRILAWRAVIHGRTQYMEERKGRFKTGAALEKLSEEKRIIHLGLAREYEAWGQQLAFAKEQLKSPDLVGVLPDVSVGAKAPRTLATDLTGRKVSLDDYRGKVVVLDFWFVGCGPCHRVIPAANAMIAEMKSRPFAQIGVNTYDEPKVIAEFIAKRPMPWVHWCEKGSGRLTELYDVFGAPEIIVIDHEGIIRHRQSEFDPKDDRLYPLVRELVKKAEASRKP